jgi:hypothetical protein
MVPVPEVTAALDGLTVAIERVAALDIEVPVVLAAQLLLLELLTAAGEAVVVEETRMAPEELAGGASSTGVGRLRSRYVLRIGGRRRGEGERWTDVRRSPSRLKIPLPTARASSSRDGGMDGRPR